MSIKKLSLLQLLLIASLANCCWARPAFHRQQQLAAARNEVTSQEGDQQLPNELLEQLAALRSPVVGQQHYKKRRPNNYWKQLQLQPQRLQWSQLRRRYHDVPHDGVIPPGGGNYYSNDVLPLSTYEIYEPEPIYSTAYY
ncbi:hypothetical protein KR093_006417 [Drosophila rubida]|uniref:Uncharacterized protein n=1 Tax=Drosophila rubida TaxID=30044 RepID=A0AAD4K523_9MUSC|nr:hypothetical protein KR093_006417 [Drosophila rubida]